MSLSQSIATGGLACSAQSNGIATGGIACVGADEVRQKRRTIVVARNVGGGKHPGGIVVAGEVE